MKNKHHTTTPTCGQEYHPAHSEEACRAMIFAENPCAKCRIRRDEHADQAVQSSIPELDITSHAFVEETA